MIDFDVETTGFQPYSGHVAFSYQFLADENDHEVIYTDEPDARDRIQAWFDRAKADPDGIRAWNAKFDRSFADTAGFDIPGDGHWHDGMIEAHTLDERRSVALKAIGVSLFGEDDNDEQKAIKAWLNAENAKRRKHSKATGELYEPANYSDVPRELMTPYALEDVVKQRRIGDIYGERLAEIDALKRCYEFERKVLDSLYAVEKRGLPASGEDYRMLELEANQNLDVLHARACELMEEGGIKDPNPNSTAQILDALRGRGADMSYMETKDGKVKSADAENLAAVDDELSAAITEFRAERLVLGTYVQPMLGRTYQSAINSYKEPFLCKDGRIHATYRQVGARTGRMSCADPNMQNQPRDDLRLRYCIRAEPGYKLVACDLSNIEMVLFAAFAGEGRLLSTIRDGGDLHTLTAEMLGFRDRARAGGVFESARQQGKVYNFSRIYGGGLRTIRKSFRCTMDEARLLKKRFDDAYPEVVDLTNIIQYRLEDQGYIEDKIISGRRWRVDPKEGYKATNYLVQGTAAIVLKEALIKLHSDGCPVVALIHDEILAHVREDEAEDWAERIQTRMTENEALNAIVPITADAEVIDHWSDAKPFKDGSLFVPNWRKEAA